MVKGNLYVVYRFLGCTVCGVDDEEKQSNAPPDASLPGVGTAMGRA